MLTHAWPDAHRCWLSQMGLAAPHKDMDQAGSSVGTLQPPVRCQQNRAPQDSAVRTDEELAGQLCITCEGPSNTTWGKWHRESLVRVFVCV